MPNVMGREFPYTPEGQAAALRYSRAIGMRGGGMMGFRPVGYQEGTGPAGVQPGGSSETEERLVQQFNLVLEGGSPGQIRTFITDHMDRLLAAAGNYPGLVEQITNSISSTVSANRGELLAPPGTGEYFIHENPDVPWTANTRDAYLGGGYPGPSFVPSGSQTAPDFEALEEVRGIPAPLPPPLPPGMEIANGGYVGRGQRGSGRGGIMSLRR